MKYTPATVAKALMAFVTAFGGAAATSAPHDPVGWAGCAGAGLVAFAAVFATPNKTDTPAPSEHVAIGLQLQKEAEAAVNAERDKIAQVVSDTIGQVPVVGPLAQQVIDSVR